MCMIRKDYRREYLSELCERIVPLLDYELNEPESAPLHEACADLKIRLTHCADWFRQCKKKQVEPKYEQEECK